MENTQQGDNMTLESFRQMRESGINPYEVGETDAASQVQEVTNEVDVDSNDIQVSNDGNEAVEDNLNGDIDVDADEHIDIPEGQKTAFQKALEREKRKAREAAETSIKEEYESQLNPYKKFFDNLGMDPEAAMQAMEQQKIKQEAENLAYQNGWSDQQAEWYIKQQQQDKEMRDLRITIQINELEGDPKYPGIKQMKPAISEFLSRNPSSNVKEGFYAVGGEVMLQQMQREIEQREKAKRTQPKRTVISDAPTDMKGGPAQLTDEDLSFMKQAKISESQLRFMKNDKGPQTLEDYRNMMKKKG